MGSFSTISSGLTTLVVPHAARITQAPPHYQVATVHIPVSALTPHAKSVRDLRCTASNAQLRKALSVFGKIAANVAMGYDTYDANQKLLEQRSLRFVNTVTGESGWVTSQYLEVLLNDDNEVVGYRLWLLVHDASFSLPRAFKNCWRTAAREMAAEKAKASRSSKSGVVPIGEDRAYLHVVTEELYIYGVAASYLRPLGIDLTEDAAAMQTTQDDGSIEMDDNDANPLQVFGLEKAQELAEVEAEYAPCAAQSDVQSYQGNFADDEEDGLAALSLSIRFPRPELVFQLPPLSANTVTAIAFPDVMRMQAQPIYPVPESLIVARSAWDAYNSKSFNEPAQDNDTDGDSVFHRLADSTEDQFAKVYAMDDGEERDELMQSLRVRQMENVAAVWDSTVPNLGRSLRLIIEWGESQQERNLRAGGEGWCVSRSESECVPVDKNLSIFGNMMVRRMHHYEVDLKVSVTHHVLELCLLSARNAYEHTFEIGVTLLLLGQAEVGKSHLLKMIQLLSIEGTTTRPCYSTEKAHLHGTHENDTVILHDEMPMDQFGAANDKSGARTGNPVLKTTMTEKKVTVEAFTYDEATGKRGMITTTAERIGTRIYCTNEQFSRMPVPIQKRLMPVNIDSFDRKHHNVMDLMAGVMGSASGASKANFIKDMHTEQFLVCLTYKLIWTNVLPDVDMTVAKLVWHAAIKNLQEEGVSTVMAPRAFTRMKCIASVLTVMHALENVFHMPGTEHYGKPFDLGMMHAVGPYLVATEEIAIYVLTLMSSAWMNEAEPDCVKELARLKCKLQPKGSPSWIGYDAETLEQKIKFRVKNDNVEDGADVSDKFDFDRLVIKGTLDSIAEELSKSTGARIMSKENIKTMLTSMRGRSIKVQKRTGPRPNDVSNVAADKMEMPILEPDGDMGNRWLLSTHWALEAGTMYGEKKMLEVIRRIFHRFTRERKIVTGFTYRNELDGDTRVVNPHVYQVLEASPNQDNLFKVPNNSDDGGVAFFVADVDLDTYAHEQHAQDAAYGEEVIENTAFSEVAQWFTNRWADQDTLDYPDALLENARHQRQEMEVAAVLTDANKLSRKRRRRR